MPGWNYEQTNDIIVDECLQADAVRGGGDVDVGAAGCSGRATCVDVQVRTERGPEKLSSQGAAFLVLP